MTPVVHMIYRLWQLGRGCLLVSVLDGPDWLIYLQVQHTFLLQLKTPGLVVFRVTLIPERLLTCH